MFYTSCSITPRLIPFGTLMFLLTVQVTTVHAQPDRTALLRAVATANARKTEVEQYVSEIKKSFRPSDPTYAESRRRYFLACSLSNEFMTAAVTSFATGRSGIGLATKASEVQLRTSEFTEYASEINIGMRRTIAELTHSATTFIDVASDRKHVTHMNWRIASALLTELQWRSWVDIN